MIVMTYNIGNGLASPTQLTTMLRESPAKIVALQEVTQTQADALSNDLSDKYPYQVVRGVGIPGKAVLSQFPIIEHEQLHLDEARPDLRCLLDVEGEPLQIIVVHPLPPRFRRIRYQFTPATIKQFELLFDICTSEDATILLGDFNMRDWNRFYKLLIRLGLIDAYRSAGKRGGFTIPQRIGKIRTIPFLRIDYIWHTRQLYTKDAWVGADAGSDHLPVLADLAWRED